MRETTDLDNPVYLNFNFNVDDIKFEHKIRLIITPHFSFNSNFMPQYRLSPEEFNEISQTPEFRNAVTVDNGFTVLEEDHEHSYREIQLDPETYESTREKLQKDYPDLFTALESYYYNPHEIMSNVLIDMFEKGVLVYDGDKNYLKRTKGSCKFCVNQHWQFKDECRYDKNFESSPPSEYLEKVAGYIIKNSKPVKKEESIH